MSKARELAELSRTVADSADAVAITVDSNENTTFTGVVTANAGVVVDNITIDGTTLALSSGNLTLDVAGDIILDAAGGEVRFSDGSQQEFVIDMNDASTKTVLRTLVSDSDLVFEGNDGGVGFAALTLDMSAAGAATFNSSVTATSLDISGDIDVDGTTNLDVVDIDGAVDMASTLAVGGQTIISADALVATPSTYYDELVVQNSASGTGAGMTILVNATNGFGGVKFGDSGNSNQFGIGFDASANLGFLDVLGGQALTIDSSRNVGIGVVPSAWSSSSTALQIGSLALEDYTVSGANVSNILNNAFRNSSGNVVYIESDFASSYGQYNGEHLFNVAPSGTAGATISFTQALKMTPSEIVANDSGADRDFRVESSGNSHMLFVDGGNNKVGIGTGSPSAFLTTTGSEGSQYAGSFTNTSTQGWGLFVKGGNDSADYSLLVQDKDANQLLSVMADGGVVINESSQSGDFRVESDTNTNALFVDASTNRVGILTASPSEALHVTGRSRINSLYLGEVSGSTDIIQGTAGNLYLTGAGSNITLGSSEAIFNEAGASIDFRVEGDSQTHALFVDASTNRVGIQDSAPSYPLDVNGAIHSATNVIIGDSVSSPGTLTLNDDSTTAYTLAMTGTGTRTFAMQGSASSGGYSMTMENLGTGGFNLRVDGQITAGMSASPFSDNAITIRGQQDGTAIKFEAGGAHRFDLDCNGTGVDNLSFNNTDGAKLFTIYRASEIVVNEDGASSVDFRVESDNNANMLRVDAGENRVITGSSSVHSIGTTNPPLQVGDTLTFQNYGVNTNVTTDTGISINQGNNGMAMQVLASNHSATGTATLAGQYFLKFYYDGNNAPAVTLVAGDNLVTFGVSGSNTLTITMPAGGNSISFITSG
jgi:hypothetical protein